MRYLGITFDSNKANLIILENNENNYNLVYSKISKILLEDEESQQGINNFKEKISSFIKDNRIDFVGIKKRKQTGKFSGGALSFKMEAILQSLTAKVELVASTTINKQTKNLEIPTEIYKYQIEAFKTAYSILK